MNDLTSIRSQIANFLDPEALKSMRAKIRPVMFEININCDETICPLIVSLKLNDSKNITNLYISSKSLHQLVHSFV